MKHQHYYRRDINDWWCTECDTVTDYCKQPTEPLCDVCSEVADGEEAGHPAMAPWATVCSDKCEAQLLLYPCAVCSAPVSDEGETCAECASN